jgi:cytochrome c-type biogenesis protein CcmE
MDERDAEGVKRFSGRIVRKTAAHEVERREPAFGSHAPNQGRHMTRKQRRLMLVGGSLVVLAAATALVLYSMSDSIVFFSTPSMVAEKHIAAGRRFRLGGLVQPGSLVHGDNLAVTFKVADGSATLPVSYQGILPDLFREGQGVVAEGALDASGVFRADTVLAKHDERYMPRDVADALKKQGLWKEGSGEVPDTDARSASTQGALR